jgi:uncharacterized protein
MKKMLLPLLLCLSLQAEQTMKVVIDLTTGNLHTFESKILKGIVSHKTYYEGELKELDVAVVIHGDAYRFFLKDPAHSAFGSDKALVERSAELSKRITALADTYGVVFLMCKAGMQKNSIDEKALLGGVKTVHNAAVGLIDKQNAGYAYLPVGD